MASGAGYVTYVPDYPQLTQSAARLAPAFQQGRPRYYDVVFVAEASRDVNWRQIQTFSKNFVDYFDIRPQGTHVGFVKYSNGAEAGFSFPRITGPNVRYTSGDVKQFIDNVRQNRGSQRNVNLGVQLARQLFSPKFGGRPNARRVVIVLTGGPWSKRFGPIRTREVAELKKLGANLYVMGIGRTVQRPQLNAVASRPGYVFMLPSYTDLPRTRPQLIQTVIFGEPKVVPTIPTTTVITPITAAPGALDVALLLDSSDDIDNANWQRILAFTKDFTGRFPNINSSPSGTRFSLISYANDPAVHFNFRRLAGSQINPTEVKRLIDSTPRRKGHERRIDSALGMADTGLFTTRGGARLGAKRYILVLVAGAQTTKAPSTSPAEVSRKLQNKGVRVYAIGVRPKAVQDQVLGVASHADYSSMTDYPKLQGSAASLAPVIVQNRGLYRDIVFLVDSSDDVNWPQIQQFTKSIVNSFDVSPTGTHFGFVTYSDKAGVGFPFPSFYGGAARYTKEDVTDLIDTVIRQRGTQRNVHLGMQSARQLYTSPYGGRGQARKDLIVISTRPWPTRYRQSWTRAAQTLKNSGVNIYPIGVGSTVSRPQMTSVASKPEYVFTPPSYDALSAEKSPVVQTVVFGARPTTTPTIAPVARDIAVVLDSSEGIAPADWQRILEFTSGFVRGFPHISAASDGTRFGLVTYATKPRVHFNFRSLTGAQLNRDEVTRLVGSTPRQPGKERRMDSALSLVDTDLFSSKGGARPGAKRYILMLMTGPQSQYPGYIAPSTISRRLRRSGVRIYSVGVAPYIVQPEVLGVASHADDVTYVRQYPQLRPAADTLAPAVQGDYGRYIDLVFIADSSRTVNWPRVQSFAKNIVRYFDISPQGTHVAFVTYTRGALASFTFPRLLTPNARYSVDDVMAFIDKSPRSQGTGQNPLVGFQLAAPLFTPQYGGRSNARRVVILISGGAWPSRYNSQILGWVNRMKSNKAEFYPLGVGPRANRAQLLSTATKPNYLFTPTSYDTLKNEEQPLVETIVFGARSQPASTTVAPTTPTPEDSFDIGLVIDTSDALRPADWTSIVQFLKGLVQKIDNLANNRFGFISYATTPKVYFRFNTLKGNKLNMNQVLQLLDRIPRQRGADRRIDSAIQMAGDELFSQKGGTRPNAKKVMIVLFTTPQATGQGSLPSDVARRLRSRGIRFYSVGVGPNFPQPQTLWTASYADNVYYTYYYDGKDRLPNYGTPLGERVLQGRGRYRDIIFIVDSSDRANWDETLFFSKYIIDSFDISPQGTHIAYITYGNRASRAFPFPTNLVPGARYDQQSVNALVQKVTRNRGTGRDIQTAFRLAYELFTTPTYGARPDARKEVIVLTSGQWPAAKSPKDSPPWQTEADRLKKLSNVYAIGIRPNARRLQLEWATRSPDTVFMTDRYPNLRNIWKDVVRRIVYDKMLTRPLDIAFAVDGASDIKKPNWKYIISFINDVLQRVDTISSDPAGTRVAIISYASDAVPYMAFRTLEGPRLNLAEVRKRLDFIPRMRGTERRIDRALDLARTTIFNTNTGARAMSRKVLVVISSGPQTTNVQESFLPDASRKLQDAGVTIYGIGAGPTFDQTHVLRTASRADYVYYNYDYSRLPSVAAPFTRALPKNVGRYLDLAFLVDSSNTVDWNQMVSYLQSLVRSFHVSRWGTHVGFISYADTANLGFDFARLANPSVETVNNLISGVKPRRGSQRRIDLGLQMALNDIYQPSRGQRRDARQALVILTSGRWPSQSLAQWQATAVSLRKSGIDLYVIGVGAQASRPQLEIVATNPGFVFTPISFPALKKEKESVVRTIVYGARKERVKPLDVGLVVDSSSDISDPNWNNIISFLRALVDGIDNVSPQPEGTRFGLISYASTPAVVFKFNTLQDSKLNAAEVKRLVKGTPRQPGSSRRIDHALQSADRDLFSSAAGARDGAQRILVVVMGGAQAFNQKRALGEAAVRLLDRGYRSYVVGVGDRYLQPETLQVASYADFVYYNKYPSITSEVAPRMGKDIVKGRGAYLDVGFLVDSSDTVSWQQMVAFTQAIAKRFDISNVGTHIGYITYSNDASIAFPMNALTGPAYTYDGIHRLIANVPHRRGPNRRLGAALNVAYQNLFSKQYGVRERSRKIVIIFTTGKWPTDRPDWKTSVQPLRKRGTDVFAVGIGRSISKNQLEAVATKPGYAFNMDSFPGQTVLTPNLIRVIVFGAQATPLDVAIAVDSSPDISSANWQYLLTFIRDFVTNVNNISPSAHGTRFGLVSYAAQPNVIFRFNTLRGARLNQREVLTLVGNAARQPGEPRRVDLALQTVRQDLFSPRGGSRPNARKILLLLYAGRQSPSEDQQLTNEYESLRRAGVNIYTVGAGRNFQQPEVLWTASHADYVYYDYKYDTLPSQAPRIGKHVLRNHGAYMDIGFIVDSSNRVDWRQMQSYVKSILASFDISYRGTHVGLITYSDAATIAFPFNAVSDTDYTVTALSRQVDGVRQQRGSDRRIDLALQMAYSRLYTAQSGARDAARRVLIIITSGAWPSRYQAAWTQTVGQLQSRNFDRYVIGVGQQVQVPQLESVASYPGYVFTPNSYVTMGRGYQRVVQVIVFGAQVPPMDIGIVVDSSSDISPSYWQYIRTYIRDFIGSFPNVSPAFDGTRFGLITYAAQPRVYFNFRAIPDSRISVNEYRSRVDTIPRQPGSPRRIDRAIDMARTDLFSTSGGARPGSRRILLVLFGGPQASGQYPSPPDVSRKLQQSGVYVYTVGYGRNFRQPEVLWTASHADWVYHRYDYNRLPQISQPQGLAVRQGHGIYLDVGFVVDSSSSADWPQMQRYSRSIVNSFHVSDIGTHFGYITYGRDAGINFGFNALSGRAYTADGVNKLITGINRRGGNQRQLHQGLQMAERDLFSDRYGARSNARQILIVITSGAWPSQYAQTWRDRAAALRRRNFDMYVIGVGSSYQRPQLQDVASQPAYVFTYPDYPRFYDGYREVVQVIIFGRDPCYGYECEKQRSYSTCQAVNGKPTCVCKKPCPSTVKKVCASDGKAYNNECEMRLYACENKKKLAVKSQGDCAFKCTATADLAFLVDASGSIGRRNFGKLKQFMKAVVDAFPVGPQQTHVAAVSYSSDAYVEFLFNSLRGSNVNKAGYGKLVDKIRHSRGYTFIDKALMLASNKIFVTANGMRPNVKKVALMITDGRQTTDRGAHTPLDQASQPLKNKGVQLISMGIGGNVDISQLTAVASNTNNVYTTSSFKVLMDDVENIVKMLCKPDPCVGHTCSKPFAICKAKNDKPVCECPSRCPKNLDPVCGSDGKTYDNECLMREAACNANKQLTVVKKGQCDCKTVVDAAFLIDSSGSIGRRNWKRMLTFIAQIVSKFNVGPAGTHIAAVTYSTGVKLEFDFNRLRGSSITAAGYNAMITTLRWQRGYTFIDKSLELANRQVFTSAGGMRPQVPKVAFVLTDGKQTRDQGRYTPLSQASGLLKAKGVRVYAMGIGKGVLRRELELIASDPKYIFEAKSFKTLEPEIDSIIRSLCEARRRL